MSDYRPTTVERRTPVGESLVTMTALTGLLWVMEVVDVLSGHRLDELGVRTRDWSDLWSVLTLPLAHANWSHLIANTLPFFVLGLLVLASATWREFVIGLVFIVLTSGLAAWLLSEPFTNTVGASGVVFGWLTYLLVRGFYTGRLSQILIAVAVFFAFGALLWGVLPGTPGVSWQGHLGGAIGGVLAARHLHKRS